MLFIQSTWFDCLKSENYVLGTVMFSEKQYSGRSSLSLNSCLSVGANYNTAHVCTGWNGRECPAWASTSILESEFREKITT